MQPERPLNLLGQLRDAYVTSISFRRNAGYDPERTDNWSYAVRSTTEGEASGDHATGFVRLNAEIVWDAEAAPQDASPPFDLELTVTGLFSWYAPDASDEEIADWLEFNGEHLLWPYLRSYVHMITGASDLPPLTIYTLSVPRVRLGADAEAQAGS